MRKLKIILLGSIFLVCLFVIFGCSTMDVSTNVHGQQLAENSSESLAHIHAGIGGIYLFYYIPLIAGNPDNVGGSLLFTDSVTPDNSVGIITKKASELGATRISNLTLNDTETGAFSFWILWYKSQSVSGNAVK